MKSAAANRYSIFAHDVSEEKKHALIVYLECSHLHELVGVIEEIFENVVHGCLRSDQLLHSRNQKDFTPASLHLSLIHI